MIWVRGEIGVKHFHCDGCCLLIAALLICLSLPRGGLAADLILSRNPNDSRLIFVIRRDSVLKELGLSKEQTNKIKKLNQRLDARLLPLRNRTHALQRRGFAKLTTETNQHLARVLSTGQYNRLAQVMFHVRGNRVLNNEPFRSRFKLSPKQQRSISELIEETDERRGRISQADQLLGFQKWRERLIEEDRRIHDLLSDEQRKLYGKLAGAKYARNQLSDVRIRAPELTGKEWINSKLPIKLSQCRGKVVVIHFFAFG